MRKNVLRFFALGARFASREWMFCVANCDANPDKLFLVTVCGKTTKLAEEPCKHCFGAASHVLYQRESYAAVFFADSAGHGYLEVQLHGRERCSSVFHPPRKHSSVSVSVMMILEPEQDV